MVGSKCESKSKKVGVGKVTEPQTYLLQTVTVSLPLRRRLERE